MNACVCTETPCDTGVLNGLPGASRWLGVLAVIVGALAVSGCGGGVDTPPARTASSTPASAASAPASSPSASVLSGTLLYRYDQYVKQIAAVKVDASGATTDIASVDVRAEVLELAVDKAHRRVYALLANFPGEEGHPNPVVIFAIQDDGSLRQQATTKLGPWPFSMALDPTGTYAYSMSPASIGPPDDSGIVQQYNGQLVETFAINADGTFTSVATGAPIQQIDFVYGGSGLIAISGDGKRLFGALSGPGQLISYAVHPDGSLTEQARAALSGNDPFGTFIVGLPQALALKPDGTHVYVAELSNGFSNYHAFNMMRTFSVSTDGLLTEDTDWVNNKINSYASVIAVTPDGKQLYDAGATAVNEFAIRADGTLDRLTTIVPGASPGGLALDPEGRFLFVANMVDGTLNSYAVEPTGLLSEIGEPRFTDRSSSILRSVQF